MKISRKYKIRSCRNIWKNCKSEGNFLVKLGSTYERARDWKKSYNVVSYEQTRKHSNWTQIFITIFWCEELKKLQILSKMSHKIIIEL